MNKVRTAEIAGKGRGVVASEDLRAGQVVLRDSPILLYSALPFVNINPNYSYCDHCFRVLSKSVAAVTCHSCSRHFFCSRTCLDSSSHSPWVCQSLSRIRDVLIDQPSDRQLQARFLIAAYNLALLSPSDFRILHSLQGTPQDSDSSDAMFLHSLISPLCPPAVSVSLELTAALLAKDKLNAFGLMEPPSSNSSERSVRAYGIYPNASFFNHDCLPNACRFDYVDDASVSVNNTDIVVRMIHDVPQGREICLSYFPVNLSFSVRQKRLVEDYGFTCDCDRCKVEANWSDQEEEEEEDDAMEDDDEEIMEEEEEEIEGEHIEALDSDFPHAYFFLRYMCNQENCHGTLAPLPPSEAGISSVFECNFCGSLKNDEVENDDVLMDD